MPRWPLSKCKNCGRLAVWAETLKGTRIFVDPESSPDGTIRLERDLEGEPLATIILVKPPPPGIALHCSHFATCEAYKPKAHSSGRKRAPRHDG